MEELDERITGFLIETIESDYPEQFKDRDHVTRATFKNKTNISKLAAALDIQLQEVQEAIKDLYKYRTLEGGYPIRTATQEFTGDGTTTAFTLTGDVYELYSIERIVDDEPVVIPEYEYTFDLATKTVTFTEAPSDGVVLVVYYRYQPDWGTQRVDKQLDNSGENVVLTRAQAGVISSPNMNTTQAPVMENEEYARYLRYKAYKNSSECTYYDLMTMLNIISGSATIGYREDPAHPATIYVKPSDWGIDFPPVAPAGVGFIVEREENDEINLFSGLGSIVKRTIRCTFDATT